MKKVILSAAFLVFAGLATTKAGTMNILSVSEAVQDSVVRTPVKLEDLPDAVKTTLASDSYKDWVPGVVHLVKDSKNAEYYQVEVKKQDEVKSLKFDKDGKPVE